jgi:hypothetical protein
MNPSLKGTFENERLNIGYFLEMEGPAYGILGREKEIYRFIAHPWRPITFVQADGTRIRTCREFLTDQGSQPPLVQGWLPKDRHVAVYFHDDMYRSGGAWIAGPGETEFTFTPLTRAQADNFLRTMLMCGERPVSAMKAEAYWIGVKLGWLWNRIFFWRPDFYAKWRPGREGTDTAQSGL